LASFLLSPLISGWSAKMGEPKTQGAQTERQAWQAGGVSPWNSAGEDLLGGENSPADFVLCHG
jgi:hypothetical protein